MSDEELERFKTNIDLRAYAAAQSYVLDVRESSAGSAVMRHPDGDKVIIKRGADSHYVFFSVRRDDDSGSIIDFVCNRHGISIGAARKELRPWIGAPPVPVPEFRTLSKSTKDRVAVERQYAMMHNADTHPYLENIRCIPRELLRSGRFAGRIRIDEYGNAIMPHFDAEGLCGFEKKNQNFTGFARNGSKGLWLSHEKDEDNKLVFAEGGIDALSYAALKPDGRARFASIGGKPNPQQPDLVRAAIARMPMSSTIVAAMDNDNDGAKLADVVASAVIDAERSDLSFIADIPTTLKDWNDVLRDRASQPLFAPLPSYRPDEPSVA